MAINGGLSAWWFHLAVVVTTHEFTNSRREHTRPPVARFRRPDFQMAVREDPPLARGPQRTASASLSAPDHQLALSKLTGSAAGLAIAHGAFPPITEVLPMLAGMIERAP